MYKAKYAILGLMLCSVVALSGCQEKGTPIAKVNKSIITQEQLNEKIKTLPDNVKKNISEQVKANMLDQMINEELLLQEAKKSGIARTEEYTNQIKMYQEQLDAVSKQTLINVYLKTTLKPAPITDEEAQTVFNTQADKFKAIPQRRANHILVKTKDEANKLLIKIKNGANFENLARENSIDPTAINGGDLGWFSEGDLLPEFENAAFKLTFSQRISNVVKSNLGYHIIKLTDKRTIPARTFDEVKGQIKQSLNTQKQNENIQKLITSLKKEGTITMLNQNKEATQQPNTQNNQQPPKS